MANEAKATEAPKGGTPNPNPASKPKGKRVKKADIAVRLLPITASVNTWKGLKDGKAHEYKKEEIASEGLDTERSVGIPFLARADFLDEQSLANGYKRVLAELRNVTSLYAAQPKSNGKVEPIFVVNDAGKELELANPADVMPTDGKRREDGAIVGDYTVADLIHDSLLSGVSLAFQAEHGKTLRDACKTKLGSPKGTGASRGSRADSDF